MHSFLLGPAPPWTGLHKSAESRWIFIFLRRSYGPFYSPGFPCRFIHADDDGTQTTPLKLGKKAKKKDPVKAR